MNNEHYQEDPTTHQEPSNDRSAFHELYSITDENPTNTRYFHLPDNLRYSSLNPESDVNPLPNIAPFHLPNDPRYSSLNAESDVNPLPIVSRDNDQARPVIYVTRVTDMNTNRRQVKRRKRRAHLPNAGNLPGDLARNRGQDIQSTDPNVSMHVLTQTGIDASLGWAQTEMVNDTAGFASTCDQAVADTVALHDALSTDRSSDDRQQEPTVGPPHDFVQSLIPSQIIESRDLLRLQMIQSPFIQSRPIESGGVATFDEASDSIYDSSTVQPGTTSSSTETLVGRPNRDTLGSYPAACGTTGPETHEVRRSVSHTDTHEDTTTDDVTLDNYMRVTPYLETTATSSPQTETSNTDAETPYYDEQVEPGRGDDSVAIIPTVFMSQEIVEDVDHVDGYVSPNDAVVNGFQFENDDIHNAGDFVRNVAVTNERLTFVSEDAGTAYNTVSSPITINAMSDDITTRTQTVHNNRELQIGQSNTNTEMNARNFNASHLHNGFPSSLTIDENNNIDVYGQSYQDTPERDHAKINIQKFTNNECITKKLNYDTRHFAKMGHYLRNIKYGKNFHDVKFEVLPKIFYAHRVALACHSPYFAKFFADKVEKRHLPLEVQIQGISAEAFELFLNYVYEGVANNIPPEFLPDVIIAGEKFRVTALLDICYEKMQNLTLESALRILLRVSSGSFYKTAYYIVLNRFPDVINSNNFNMLDVGTVIKILSDDRLNTPSETLVFNTIVRWIQSADAFRSEYIHQLLTCVRFSIMPTTDELFACAQSYIFHKFDVNWSRLFQCNWIITARQVNMKEPFGFNVDRHRIPFSPSSERQNMDGTARDGVHYEDRPVHGAMEGGVIETPIHPSVATKLYEVERETRERHTQSFQQPSQQDVYRPNQPMQKQFGSGYPLSTSRIDHVPAHLIRREQQPHRQFTQPQGQFTQQQAQLTQPRGQFTHPQGQFGHPPIDTRFEQQDYTRDTQQRSFDNTSMPPQQERPPMYQHPSQSVRTEQRFESQQRPFDHAAAAGQLQSDGYGQSQSTQPYSPTVDRFQHTTGFLHSPSAGKTPIVESVLVTRTARSSAPEQTPSMIFEATTVQKKSSFPPHTDINAPRMLTDNDVLFDRIVDEEITRTSQAPLYTQQLHQYSQGPERPYPQGPERPVLTSSMLRIETYSGRIQDENLRDIRIERSSDEPIKFERGKDAVEKKGGLCAAFRSICFLRPSTPKTTKKIVSTNVRTRSPSSILPGDVSQIPIEDFQQGRSFPPANIRGIQHSQHISDIPQPTDQGRNMFRHSDFGSRPPSEPLRPVFSRDFNVGQLGDITYRYDQDALYQRASAPPNEFETDEDARSLRVIASQQLAETGFTPWPEHRMHALQHEDLRHSVSGDRGIGMEDREMQESRHAEELALAAMRKQQADRIAAMRKLQQAPVTVSVRSDTRTYVDDLAESGFTQWGDTRMRNLADQEHKHHIIDKTLHVSDGHLYRESNYRSPGTAMLHSFTSSEQGDISRPITPMVHATHIQPTNVYTRSSSPVSDIRSPYPTGQQGGGRVIPIRRQIVSPSPTIGSFSSTRSIDPRNLENQRLECELGNNQIRGLDTHALWRGQRVRNLEDEDVRHGSPMLSTVLAQQSAGEIWHEDNVTCDDSSTLHVKITTELVEQWSEKRLRVLQYEDERRGSPLLAAQLGKLGRDVPDYRHKSYGGMLSPITESRAVSPSTDISIDQKSFVSGSDDRGYAVPMSRESTVSSTGYGHPQFQPKHQQYLGPSRYRGSPTPEARTIQSDFRPISPHLRSTSPISRPLTPRSQSFTPDSQPLKPEQIEQIQMSMVPTGLYSQFKPGDMQSFHYPRYQRSPTPDMPLDGQAVRPFSFEIQPPSPIRSPTMPILRSVTPESRPSMQEDMQRTHMSSQQSDPYSQFRPDNIRSIGPQEFQTPELRPISPMQAPIIPISRVVTPPVSRPGTPVQVPILQRAIHPQCRMEYVETIDPSMFKTQEWRPISPMQAPVMSTSRVVTPPESRPRTPEQIPILQRAIHPQYRMEYVETIDPSMYKTQEWRPISPIQAPAMPTSRVVTPPESRPRTPEQIPILQRAIHPQYQMEYTEYVDPAKFQTQEWRLVSPIQTPATSTSRVVTPPESRPRTPEEIQILQRATHTAYQGEYEQYFDPSKFQTPALRPISPTQGPVMPTSRVVTPPESRPRTPEQIPILQRAIHPQYQGEYVQYFDPSKFQTPELRPISPIQATAMPTSGVVTTPAIRHRTPELMTITQREIHPQYQTEYARSLDPARFQTPELRPISPLQEVAMTVSRVVTPPDSRPGTPQQMPIYRHSVPEQHIRPDFRQFSPGSQQAPPIPRSTPAASAAPTMPSRPLTPDAMMERLQMSTVPVYQAPPGRHLEREVIKETHVHTRPLTPDPRGSKHPYFDGPYRPSVLKDDFGVGHSAEVHAPPFHPPDRHANETIRFKDIDVDTTLTSQPWKEPKVGLSPQLAMTNAEDYYKLFAGASVEAIVSHDRVKDTGESYVAYPHTHLAGDYYTNLAAAIIEGVTTSDIDRDQALKEYYESMVQLKSTHPSRAQLLDHVSEENKYAIPVEHYLSRDALIPEKSPRLESIRKSGSDGGHMTLKSPLGVSKEGGRGSILDIELLPSDVQKSGYKLSVATSKVHDSRHEFMDHLDDIRHYSEEYSHTPVAFMLAEEVDENAPPINICKWENVEANRDWAYGKIGQTPIVMKYGEDKTKAGMTVQPMRQLQTETRNIEQWDRKSISAKDVEWDRRSRTIAQTDLDAIPYPQHLEWDRRSLFMSGEEDRQRAFLRDEEDRRLKLMREEEARRLKLQREEEDRVWKSRKEEEERRFRMEKENQEFRFKMEREMDDQLMKWRSEGDRRSMGTGGSHSPNLLVCEDDRRSIRSRFEEELEHMSKLSKQYDEGRKSRLDREEDEERVKRRSRLEEEFGRLSKLGREFDVERRERLSRQDDRDRESRNKRFEEELDRIAKMSREYSEDRHALVKRVEEWERKTQMETEKVRLSHMQRDNDANDWARPGTMKTSPVEELHKQVIHEPSKRDEQRWTEMVGGSPPDPRGGAGRVAVQEPIIDRENVGLRALQANAAAAKKPETRDLDQKSVGRLSILSGKGGSDSISGQSKEGRVSILSNEDISERRSMMIKEHEHRMFLLEKERDERKLMWEMEFEKSKFQEEKASLAANVRDDKGSILKLEMDARMHLLEMRATEDEERVLRLMKEEQERGLRFRQEEQQRLSRLQEEHANRLIRTETSQLERLQRRSKEYTGRSPAVNITDKVDSPTAAETRKPPSGRSPDTIGEKIGTGTALDEGTLLRVDDSILGDRTKVEPSPSLGTQTSVDRMEKYENVGVRRVIQFDKYVQVSIEGKIEKKIATDTGEGSSDTKAIETSPYQTIESTIKQIEPLGFDRGVVMATAVTERDVDMMAAVTKENDELRKKVLLLESATKELAETKMLAEIPPFKPPPRIRADSIQQSEMEAKSRPMKELQKRPHEGPDTKVRSKRPKSVSSLSDEIFDASDPSARLGDLLIIGGHNAQTINYSNESTIYRYSRLQDKWASFVRLPEPRLHHSATKLGNNLFLVGGCGLKDASSPEASNFRFNYGSKKWFVQTPMKRRRMYHRVCAALGMLYAVGGMNEYGEVVKTVECYHPGKDAWKFASSMSIARVYPAVATCQDKIYVAGGYGEWDIETATRPILQDVERYDPRTNTWTNVCPLPTARYHSNMISAHGKLYIIGGAKQHVEGENPATLHSLPTIDSYNPKYDKWSHVTDMVTPRHAAGSTLVGNKIYIVGGISCPANRYVQSIEVYDTVREAWCNEMPFACRSFDCIVLPQS